MNTNRHKRPKITYSDAEQAEFCDTAKEVGIGRAMRSLGYPQSYITGVKWMSSRGIEPNVDKNMQKIKAFHTYYQVDDLLMTFDNAISTAEDMLIGAEDADDLKKIADALYKIVQTRNLLEGKATAINEKREVTQQDLEILELLNIENARNAAIEENAEESADISSINEGTK